MNQWLDITLVIGAVVASAGYAIYALGPKRLRDHFTRWVTRIFGLRTAKFFSGSTGCNDCGPPRKNLFKTKDGSKPD